MSLRVFIVDSGRMEADGMLALLQFMGHQIRAVPGAERILDEALEFRADVSLLDWTVRAAEQRCSELALSGAPIVAVAGSADARALGQAADGRFAAVMALPCSRAELSKVLAKVEDEVYQRRREFDDLTAMECFQTYLAEWQRLMQTLVIRFYGGMRDGQELTGRRAIDLYHRLGEVPAGRSFRAKRLRRVRPTESDEEITVVDEQRYVVQNVIKTPSQTLIVARHRDLPSNEDWEEDLFF